MVLPNYTLKQVLIAYPRMTKANSLRLFLKKYPEYNNGFFFKTFKQLTDKSFRGFKPTQFATVHYPTPLRAEILTSLREIKERNPFLKYQLEPYQL